MSGLWFDLVLVVVLIGLNGILAGTEMAFVSLREGQLQRLAEDGPRERRVAELARHPNRYLGAIQLGITLAGFMASAMAAISLSEPLSGQLGIFGRYASPVAIAGVTGCLVLVGLVFGELVPKRLAMQRAEGWSLAMVRPLLLLIALTRPVVFFLGLVTNLIVRVVGGDPTRHKEHITDEEIVDLVAAQSSLSRTQRQIMAGAIEIADRALRHVLVPRNRVMTLDAALPVEDALSRLRVSGHARAPVVQDQLDDPVGQVHLRDLMDPGGTVADRTTAVLALPETLSVLDGLRRFQTSRTELAIVIDEHGGTAGIVTIEDLLEELVGELYDETDTALGPIETGDGGVMVLPGSFPIHELAAIGIDLPAGDYVTIAGLVLDRLGRLPGVGDRVTVGGHDVIVQAIDQRSIVSVGVLSAP